MSSDPTNMIGGIVGAGLVGGIALASLGMFNNIYEHSFGEHDRPRKKRKAKTEHEYHHFDFDSDDDMMFGFGEHMKKRVPMKHEDIFDFRGYGY